MCSSFTPQLELSPPFAFAAHIGSAIVPQAFDFTLTGRPRSRTTITTHPRPGQLSRLFSLQERPSRQPPYAFPTTKLRKSSSVDGSRLRLSLNNLRVRMLSEASHHDSMLDCMGEEEHILAPDSDSESGDDEGSQKVNNDEKKDKAKLVEEEDVQTGRVEKAVYYLYLKAIGLPICALVVLFAGLGVGSHIGMSAWLSYWSDQVDREHRMVEGHVNISMATTNTTGLDYSMDEPSIDLPSVNLKLYLGVYTALGLAQAVFITIQDIIGRLAGLKTSTVQHSRLLHNILAAPVGFFDRTPIGRILNRFSSDIATVDDQLPSTFVSLLRSSFHMLGAIILIGVTTPWSLVVWVVLGALYGVVQIFYVSTQRQLNRLLSANRSPIYAHFSETLAGVSTIRAYGHQKLFTKQTEDVIDKYNKVYYPVFNCNRWLAICLEQMGNTVVLAAAVLAVAGRETLSAGVVGLSVSLALTLYSMWYWRERGTLRFNFFTAGFCSSPERAQISHQLTWAVRFVGALETNIVSVERIKAYSEKKQEAARVIEDCRPDPNWPFRGEVNISDLNVRYREGMDLVLKGVSCKIAPAERIGIVGRTGAGKSSLTLTLFRILEADGGCITIDGVDIAKIGLHDLRSQLTIIPQDPVILSGTLRMNLDPFDQHTDDDLWRVLRLSHLHDYVSSLAEGLEYKCSEGGDNLSVGQRQLVCLARALLRNTKVLILDEATAAVDLETDNLIQATIRSEFKDCTVLTIAHRLNTIMDSARIMVLDQGQIVEMDSPENLLKNKKSIFYRMAKDAGLIS